MTRTGLILTPASRATAAAAQRALAALASPAHAAVLARFFKTAPGEYGAGDIFRGVRVPQVRHVARDFRALEFPELAQLLASRWHEDRLLALIILATQYDQATRYGDPRQCARLHDFYLAHLSRVNNWDLVDSSADKIVGAHLWHAALRQAPHAAAVAPSLAQLHTWAASENVWERRVAIISTFYFIRQGYSAATLELAASLLGDPHALIHKATGWMLREAGKRDPAALRAFLATHHAGMPRTMLRYAIERLSPTERAKWLRGAMMDGGVAKS